MSTAEEETAAVMEQAASRQDEQKRKRAMILGNLRSDIEGLPVYERNPSLCDCILEDILPLYFEAFDASVWNKIRKRFAKELNETEPAISYILNLLADHRGDDHPSPFSIVDLCSGFGIASMLLSDLLKLKSIDQLVRNIYLLDKQWPGDIYNPQPQHISTAHILQRKDRDRDKNWPVPLITRKIDLKKPREKKQLPKYVYRKNKIIFMGIHLCKKLSVHAINLFAECGDQAVALVLKPCCLPGGSREHHLYVRDINHKRVPIDYKFANGYSFRVVDLYRSCDDNGASSCDADKIEVQKKEDDVSSALQADDNISTSPDSDNEIGTQDNRDNHGGSSTGGRTYNARFSEWLDHLECSCQSDSYTVWRDTVVVQKHHFQNQFLFCQRIDY